MGREKPDALFSRALLYLSCRLYKSITMSIRYTVRVLTPLS